MIYSFDCKETERIFHGEFSKKFPENIQRVARRKILMLDATLSLLDLRIPPSNRLEALKGSKKGLFSIRINEQWRITFRWHDGDIYNAKIIDYHS